MPRYFTHLYDSAVLLDELGEEFASLADARIRARTSAGELIADTIVQGTVVDLSHRLEVIDEKGRVVIVLRFSEMFRGSGTAPHIALI